LGRQVGHGRARYAALGEAWDASSSMGLNVAVRIGGDGACLVGRKIELYSRLNPNEPGFDLGVREGGGVVKVRNFFVTMSRCHYLIICTDCFKGWITRRGNEQPEVVAGDRYGLLFIRRRVDLGLF
jgi:hypothetical protein